MIKHFINNLTNILIPHCCCGCGDVLFAHEYAICNKCLYNLPRTNFINSTENALAEKFWGKVMIEQAAAAFYFERGLNIQEIFHNIKYKNNLEAAKTLTLLALKEIENKFDFNVDYIVPIPMHLKKKKHRKYNQAEVIANIISEQTAIPINNQIIIKNMHNESQTKKHRYERWLNAKDSYTVNNEIDLDSKHILLVDDIVTTGSTFEACAIELKKSANCNVSVFALAASKK